MIKKISLEKFSFWSVIKLIRDSMLECYKADEGLKLLACDRPDEGLKVVECDQADE